MDIISIFFVGVAASFFGSLLALLAGISVFISRERFKRGLDPAKGPFWQLLLFVYFPCFTILLIVYGLLYT